MRSTTTLTICNVYIFVKKIWLVWAHLLDFFKDSFKGNARQSSFCNCCDSHTFILIIGSDYSTAFADNYNFKMPNHGIVHFTSYTQKNSEAVLCYKQSTKLFV